MSKSSADTPLMQQHKAIKQRYPDAVLLFRVGDFYETFGQDAIIASQVLGITLTKRNNGAASSSELAGFPHHALDTYLHKLVKAGYRVAICDQLEDPKQAKGIVKRGVTEMVTPGTTTNEKLLEHHSNNFLGAVFFAEEERYGIAFLDISTGEFFLAQGDREYADKLLQSFQPAEVLFQRNQQKNFKEYFGSKFYTYTLDEWIFQDVYAQETLLKHFQTHSLKGFGVEELSLGLVAAGAILHYLRDTEHPNLQHIASMQRIDREDFLWMDRFTIRNLELLGGPNSDAHSLLKVLDQTVSPMGARLLKRWMVFPLKDLTKINERLDLVEYFITQVEERNKISHHIRLCGDVERLVSKIPLKKIGPRELIHLAKGLQQVKEIQASTATSPNEYLRRLSNALNPCTYIAEKILNEIMENPAPTTAKGNYIAAGVSAELDDLRAIASKGKEYLVQLQQEEAGKTGIPSLKIGFNNVFGYYLEVTNTHKNKVPETWTRKQTLTNAERYITPELKEYEEKITGAEDRILSLELSLFESILNELQDFLSPIQTNGNILAIIDCLLCFSANAVQFGYKKPVVTEQEDLLIEAGRHPVIERYLNPGDQYVANDLILNKTDQQIIILTGPNMSGKSALLRQVAIITLMAHMGSFVPANLAKLPLTDKIFTRVGASDNLSGGESTFMVEMNETASILNNVTHRSLILLDEIGRGTSTYDGISIAWSMVEHLHQIAQQPLTLFATHYHELNELENNLGRVRNFHITNKEVGNKIIFLRKLAPGGSTHSFGIHVARMAGMPASLINRANEILEQLETQSIQTIDSGEPAVPALTEKVKEIGGPKMQLSIFDVHTQTFDSIRKTLDGLDINRLTPVEALLKLQEIKNMIR
ncbi:DNA mismatch repair protein MutS [Flavihumibacter sp. CACIAM 22H1]|uniref:DNA mismatch repair protein MutS n=1 Tax=Flavihumibacter sp. CACIAM 22H1 TaxID=1812911 RepID=UPI0007A7D691|nr:DNA mismatch repair protein MutS [Flavihumibacter sp. CACIAM 22H1]KYP14088.1 MAG: DNA mismatch repair protein MutS [Flavihumibacter sp. CACIAM 22H1]